MPLKPEVVLSYLDIDPAKYEDEDSFKADFNKAWVKTELAAKDPAIHGRALAGMNGKLRSRAKKFAKAVGLEVDVTDDTDVAEFFETATELLPKKFVDITTTYEAKLKEATSDASGKEWETKYTELNKKYGELNGLHQEQVKKYGELETGIKTEKVNARKDAYWKDALGQVKFKQGLDDLTKEGFVAKMRSEFQIQVDDEDKLYTADREGNRITDKAKAQKFRELPELLAEKAKEFKLDQSNHQGLQPLNRPVLPQQQQTQAPQPGTRPLREVHPARFAQR